MREEVLEAYALINEQIERLATYPETCLRLVEYTRDLTGNHVEIGCLYGGSLILVAMFKPRGHIYGVDPLDQFGYYGGADWPTGKNIWPSSKMLRKTIRRFGFQERITHVDKFSDPWPAELEDMQFDTAYIDGDHTTAGAYKDFLNLRERVNHYIIWDDVGENTSVRKAFDMACEHLSWEPVLVEGNVGIIEHVGQIGEETRGRNLHHYRERAVVG